MSNLDRRRGMGWSRSLGGDGASARSSARKARPSLESLEGKVLLTLSPVPQNAGFPFTSVVELQATFPDHKTYVGSGAMVDSFHVLTAGHMLYSYSDGGWASSIVATPDEYGSSRPYGTASMTYERTYTAWVNYSRSHPPDSTAPGDFDIGLITLNRNIGNSTGWMSYGSDPNNRDFSPGVVMDTAGYPSRPYDGSHMYQSIGGIAGLSSDGSAIDYYQSQITTYGGQSGSPVWKYNASTGSRVIYGVHVGGSGAANSLNFATRITSQIFNDLQSWRQADAKPRFIPAGALGTMTFVASASPSTPDPAGYVASGLAESSAPAPAFLVASDPVFSFGLAHPSGPKRPRS